MSHTVNLIVSANDYCTIIKQQLSCCVSGYVNACMISHLLHPFSCTFMVTHCVKLLLTCTLLGAGNPSAVCQRDSNAVVIAQSSIQTMKEKFSILVMNSHRKLQSRKTDVDEVHLFLLTMYSSPDSKDKNGTIAMVVESTKNLNEIFRALSKYGLWDYLNYYLLQSIINAFAKDDDELNSMIGQYQRDLTGHILTINIQTYLDTTDCDLPLFTTSDSENPTDDILSSLPPLQKCEFFKKLTFKVNANITDHSLHYVIDLWQSLAKQFALPQLAMILHNIAEGCIGITWLLPSNLVKYVTKMAQRTTNMFAKKHILKVILDERCIYPLEIKSSLLETEKIGRAHV